MYFIAIKDITIKIIIVFILSIFLSSNLFSFPTKSKYLTATYNSSDGLSHNIVSSIIQDKQGFLWIGTYGGLNRYDGYEFRKFRMRDGLVFDNIRALIEGANNEIWIGTEKGLSRFQENVKNKNQKFQNFTEADGLAGNNIRALAFDKRGILYIGSKTGLSILSGNTIKQISQLEKKPITAITIDKNNLVWIGTRSNGIFIMEKERILFDQSKISSEIISIKSDFGATRMIVSTRDEGLYFVSYNSSEVIETPITKYESLDFSDKEINDLRICKNELNKSLNFFSPKGKSYVYEDGNYENYTTKNLNVCNIDREGNIWIGTYGLGLQKLYKRRAISYTEEDLLDPGIRYIFKDSKNRLWLGTNNNITLHKDNTFHYLKSDESNNLIKQVRSIIEFNGKIWFGTDGKLLYYDSDKIQNYHLKKFKKPNIYSLAEYGKKLFLILSGTSLISIDTKTGEETKIDIPKELHPGIMWKLSTDKPKKSLVIQGSEKILLLSGNKVALFLEKEYFKNKEGKKNLYKIQNFQYNSKDDYLLADDKVIIKKKNILYELTTHEGLPSNNVISLSANSDTGDIWIGTSKGILRYSKEHNTVFNKTDGLAGDFCNLNSLYVDDKNVYVGSSEGLSVIDLNINYNSDLKPNITFTKIKTNENNDFYNLKKKIVLAHNENTIYLYASNLSLRYPDKTKYKFTSYFGSKKIEEKITDQNYVAFYNLGNGLHKFTVATVDNKNTDEVIIEITPACWQTFWFRLLVISVFIGFLFFIYRIRVYRIRMENIKLEKLIKQRTKELRKEKENSENLLLNILPESIADRLKNGESNIADSFKEVTVLFADIVGFTKLSQTISAWELVVKLNDLFSSFDKISINLGVEKIKTIGDCYMAVCGLPKIRENHAELIVELAKQMLVEISKFNKKYDMDLSIRIGINTGEVVAGVIGEHKYIYDLWGDTVNTASRMESNGVPGQIHITESTMNKLKNKYSFHSRGEMSIKGKGQMKTYLLQ